MPKTNTLAVSGTKQETPSFRGRFHTSFHYPFPMKQIRHIPIPSQAKIALNVIERAGYSAWLVGGFVRDALRGVKAHDLDIATNARWEAVKQLFERAGFSVHETGTKHGTVTAVVGGWPIEITTFRTEGSYSDSRHPDSVVFVDRIQTDLARRDFTMNAIAYHPERGFMDPYDGRKAIENRIIECVGDPSARFAEDALRIMRGIRFAAQLGFSIRSDTASAMLRRRNGLENVAKERIQDEMERFLMGPHVENVLPFASPILETVIPELKGALGRDIARTAQLLAQAPCMPPARYAALFLGAKEFSSPLSPYWKENLIEEIAAQALKRLRASKNTLTQVRLLAKAALIEVPPTQQGVHRFAVNLGGDKHLTRTALELRASLLRASGSAEEPQASACLPIFEKVVAQNLPLSIRDLAITGRDLMALGVEPGPTVRRLLQDALEQCIECSTPNTREALLHLVSIPKAG